MFKRHKSIMLLIFILLVVTSCTGVSTNIPDSTPVANTKLILTPTPTPTLIPIPPYTPTPVPTPTPTATPSCILGFIHCTTPTPVPCKSKYAYATPVNEGLSWVVIDQLQDQNRSTTAAQVTFTSKTATTVTVTDQAGVTETAKASALVIEESVQVQINISVSLSVSTTIGNNYTFTLPPGKTVYANYGVRVQVVNGHLYDQAGCEGNKSDWGADLSYLPLAVGWCVWTDTDPPCPSIHL